MKEDTNVRLSENRVIAWIVLAVCVIGSVFGLGGASIARERADILEVFHEGADDRDNTHCMSVYLERAFENARTMALELQLVKGDDRWLNEIMDAFDAGTEPGAYKYMTELNGLRQLADEMYNKMYSYDLTDAQRRDFKLAYDDFQGAVRMMEKDPYHELAAEFNDGLADGFIVRGVSGLLGIKPLSAGF